jgi:hypothetical protein
MRAKDEAKFLAEAYKTVIQERVVDGELMCPEACCGAPVMECKCGPDCPHCNCHEIQKLSKKEEDEEDGTDEGECESCGGLGCEDCNGTGLESTRQFINRMEEEDKEEDSERRTPWDLSGGWSSSRDWAGEMEDKEEAMRKKVAKIRAKRQESEDTEDIFPNSEYGDHLRRAAKQHEQEDKETDREASDREASDRKEKQATTWERRAGDDLRTHCWEIYLLYLRFLDVLL